MTIIVVYCCALSVIALLVSGSVIVERQRRRTSAFWAVDWIRQLRCLLELFPKHRGMANALLKGDGSFRQPMEKLQQTISTQIQTMQALVRKCGDSSIQRRFQAIENQWRAIREGVFQMQAKESFTVHTQLIEMVIERMEDDSLELGRLVSDNRQLNTLLAVLTRELPHVVESIGQARGIGTGVAAQRASTVANRVNLKYLHGKTQSILTDKLIPLRSVLHECQEVRTNLSTVVEGAVSATQNFLEVIHTELINVVKPSIAPEQFYQQGTSAIEAGFRLFDQLYPCWIQATGLQRGEA